MRAHKSILMTGGHVTPALAVIDTIMLRNIPCTLSFIGRRYINNHEKTETFEYQEIVKRAIPFVHLEAGRLTRIISRKTISEVFLIPWGILKAFRILFISRPDCVLTFGGYIGLAVSIAAFLLRIPVYSHEQTICPGLANRVIAYMSRKVFVSFAESTKYFSRKNIVVSGNPIRPSVFHPKELSFLIPHNRPVIYVTGGSLGAHAINILIEEILEQLLKEYTLIHQTGNVKEFGDFERLTMYQSGLPKESKSHYIVRSHISDEEIGTIYKTADLVIGRSGANTFFELLALKKPAILIPLPWSAHDEQRKQAQLFADYGLGMLFEQDGKSSALYELIQETVRKKEYYKSQFTSIPPFYNAYAADIIIDTVCKS